MEGHNLLNVCTRCLGRAFAMKGSGITNVARGNDALARGNLIPPTFTHSKESDCNICNGIFGRLQGYSNQMKMQSKNYEYETFLIGSRFPQEVIDLEEKFQAAVRDSEGESLRKEFNRELGKQFEASSGKSTNFNDPDITFIIDMNYDSIKLQIKSLFIYGTYLKLIRNIPQTRWIKYSEITDSVESVIGEAILPLAGGHEFFLHGAGREDVDVRMLGNGREFVLEVTGPLRRNIDLEAAQIAINSSGKGVEVHSLSLAGKNKVIEVKSERNNKTYVAKIGVKGGITEKQLMLNSLNAVCGKPIYQRTPLRVAESRSDAIRERNILDARLLEMDENSATVEITAEAGTYIKEFINGDNGRTKGSLSEVYGKSLEVLELDVIKIHRGE